MIGRKGPGKVSDCRCVSDCRSRGREFDSSLDPFSSLLLIQEGLLSVTSESMCTKYWLTSSQACPGKKSVVR